MVQSHLDNLPPEIRPNAAEGNRRAWSEPAVAPALVPAALALAFFALGLQFCLPRLLAFLHLRAIPFLDLALCLPAVLLGTWSWLRSRSFANSWPVILCVLLVWFGLLYAERSESRRGLYHAALFTVTLPVAALIVQQRAWAFCAKAFVFGSVSATLIVGWLQIVVERGWTNLANLRFGLYYLRWRGGSITNPNEVGFQLAQAAVLAFLIYLQSGSAGRNPGGRNAGRLGLVWTAILGAGCLLTVSRGAIVAGFAGLTVLVLWGTRNQDLARVKDMLVAGILGLVLVLFLAVASGRTPWEGLKARFVGDKTTATLGSRTQIWKNVHRAMCSSSKYLLFGAGTGMASQVLGRFDTGAMEDDYGQLYRSCHNIYLDWLLTYGLLGFAIGSCFALAAWHRTVELDRRDGGVARMALLATLGLQGMTGVMYHQASWVAIGSLALAMLSDATLFAGSRPRRMAVHPLLERSPLLHGPRSYHPATAPVRSPALLSRSLAADMPRSHR